MPFPRKRHKLGARDWTSLAYRREANATLAITTNNLGDAKCYLVGTDAGYILIDSGVATRRDQLETALAAAGCGEGDLQLVRLTHGDLDHAGNGAYLQAQYGARIAIHEADAGMVEQGELGWNRKAKPDKVSFFLWLVSWLGARAKTDPFETFHLDLTLDEGFDLAAFGLAAQVLHLPGHGRPFPLETFLARHAVKG